MLLIRYFNRLRPVFISIINQIWLLMQCFDVSNSFIQSHCLFALNLYGCHNNYYHIHESVDATDKLKAHMCAVLPQRTNLTMCVYANI